MKEVLGLVTGNFGKMLDEVGKTMANELSLLAANLTHKTNEIALYRK